MRRTSALKTINKIESKGYSVRMNMGHRDGECCIVSITALKNGREISTKPNATQLLKSI